MMLSIREITALAYGQNKAYMEKTRELYGKGRDDLPEFDDVDEKVKQALDEQTEMIIAGKQLPAPSRNTNIDKMMQHMCIWLVNALKELR